MATQEDLESGAKVKYHTGDEKWKNGVIHAVRKVDDIDGVPRVLTYLIDTGNDERIDEIVTPRGVPNLYNRQPEQVDVRPEFVKER
jgi:hypothetical protein